MRVSLCRNGGGSLCGVIALLACGAKDASTLLGSGWGVVIVCMSNGIAANALVEAVTTYAA